MPSARSQTRAARSVPGWFADAKLGIFIHWGLFSVPAFAPRRGSLLDVLREHYDDMMLASPYADWYENALRYPESETARHHAKRHGGRVYADFRADFERALAQWRPEAWADRFAAAGARYVVMVTKHHDGYCLWPSEVPHPRRAGWRCPRDLVGELAAAVRARGLRFGVYYSGGIDWSFEPAPVRDLAEFAASVPGGDYPHYADAQCRELIRRYRPDVLWNDIAWPGSDAGLRALLAEYRRAVPEGVVNDRWTTPGLWLSALRVRPVRRLVNEALRRRFRRPGAALDPLPSRHGDFSTPEYGSYAEIRARKWESTRGIGNSFGYNRNEREEDYLTPQELVHGLADIVSKNGNLLLNVGPRGEDAAIPELQAARLDALGEWLARHGAALYDTRPWRRAEGMTREGVPLRFTARGALVHAILLGTPRTPRITLQGVRAAPGGELRVTGLERAGWRQEGDDLVVEFAAPLPEAPAHSLVFTPA